MPLQRPPQLAWPYLNPASPIYPGLIFAGLGPHPGGYDYHDCSPYRKHGTLTNMAVPATATSGWKWDNFLGRWALMFDANSSNKVTFNAISLGTTYSYSEWIKGLPPYTFSSGAYSYALNVASATLAQHNTGSPYVSFAISPELPETQWYHACIRRVDTSVELFINGVQQGGVQTLSSNYAQIPYIEKAHGGNGYATFTSADAMLWKSIALSNAQISALADPSNTMLSVGNTPLILPPRRILWPVAVAGGHPARRRFGGVPYAALNRGVW